MTLGESVIARNDPDECDRTPDGVYLSAYRFLSKEASLLDRRDYAAWLALLTDDVHYRITAQIHVDAASGPKDYAIIDEDAVALRARVEQIAEPRLTHAENPPSLARRLFSSLTVEEDAATAELVAQSSILVFRANRDSVDGSLYAGFREDRLRWMDGKLRLARRFVRLDQSLLHGCVSLIF